MISQHADDVIVLWITYSVNIDRHAVQRHCWLYVIISPKFKISGILWFWSGRRRRIRRRRIRRRRRRTPRLVFHVTATPIKFIFDTAIDDLEWKNPIDFGDNQKTKMAANGHFVKI